jgi:hypothetical protein
MRLAQPKEAVANLLLFIQFALCHLSNRGPIGYIMDCWFASYGDKWIS